MLITSDKLIEDIRRLAAIPPNSLTNDKILDIVNEEILLNLVPLIKSVNKEYLVDFIEVTISDNKDSIDIPSDAIANGVREVLISQDGSSQYYTNVPQISINQLANQDRIYNNRTLSYYFIGNKIQLVGEYFANYKLKIFYLRRPSSLIALRDSANLSNVDDNAIEINAALTGVNKIDIIDRDGNLTHSNIDVNVDASNPLRLVLLKPLDSAPSVGSYVAQSGTSPVVNGFPQEAMPLLKEYVNMRLMQQIENNSAIKRSMERIQKLEQNFLELTSPRNIGELPILTKYF